LPEHYYYVFDTPTPLTIDPRQVAVRRSDLTTRAAIAEPLEDRPMTDPDLLRPHRLRPEERAAFERDGFILLPGVLDPAPRARLAAVADELAAQHRPRAGFGPREERAGGLGAEDRLNLKDCAALRPELLALLTWPQTLPKVLGILGWNIQLYHSQLVVAPTEREAGDANRPGWHRDSGRLTVELETDPQPRVSLKVGFHLSDATAPDRGNMWVVPGSHLWPRGLQPEDDDPRALPVLAAAGDAVLFDRRLWHRGGVNRAAATRKILFYGYSYRWFRPRSDLVIDAATAAACDPVQRQLLGVGSSNISCTSPLDADVPLKAVLAELAREPVGQRC